MIESKKKPLTILLASPRGFCAGVDRAILIVERAIELYGRPVYVRHEIVHNRHVVESLEAKGAIFVEELDDVPDDRPVVFSAHGVPKAVPAEAGRRNLLFIDATCPLVSKVHREAERHHEAGRTVVLIGHAGHPEVVGTMGQLPAGAVLLVQDVAEAERLEAGRSAQPRLRHADDLVGRRHDRDRGGAASPLPGHPWPQDGGHLLRHHQPAGGGEGDRRALRCAGGDRRPQLLQLHASRRSAANYGCRKSRLVQRAADMDWAWLAGAGRLGITAGASAPDLLVDELIAACRERYDVTIEEVCTTEENVVFKLPRALVA